MGAINGTAVVLYSGSDIIGLCKSNGLSLATAMIDISNKSSGGYKQVIPGQKSGSYNLDGIYDDSAAFSYSDLFAAWKAGTALTIKMASTVVGSKAYSATCYIDSLDTTAGMEDAQTFSLSVVISGEPSETTVS